MNKTAFIMFSIVLTAVALTATGKTASKTLAERKADKAAVRLKYEREEGGDAIRPGSVKGRILIANAQNVIDQFEIEEIRDFLWDQLNFRIDVEKSEPVSFATVDAALRKSGANCGLFLVEDKALPILLTAPENHWAILNCTPLAEEAKTPKYVEMRIKKELVRAFTLLCSGGSSMYPRSSFDAINTPSDLDRIGKIEFKVDNLDRFKNYLEPLGVTPAIRTSYANAVYEDWCPLPTNVFQKALWDQARKPPEKPIKIQYDKARQKPVVK